MTRRMFAVLCVCSIFIVFGLISPTTSNAGVNVSVTIPLPPLVFPGPPALVVMPGTYAYFAPDAGVNIFFYHGYWYRPYRGRWYLAAGYNGPWGSIAVERVPGVLRGFPPNYRRVPPGYERMPYRTVRSNWRTWENGRYWDRYERNRKHREDYDRGEHAGPEHGRGRGGMMGRQGNDY
jgi:hypothetical protein